MKIFGLTGEKKYRMGLKPIAIDSWLNRAPGKKLINHKKNHFSKSYGKSSSYNS